MRSHRIATVGGDGIGPEVVEIAVSAMRAAADRFGFRLHTQGFDLGAGRFLDRGQVLERSDIEELSLFDAILFGAVGDERVEPGVLERGLVLRLRTELRQSINVRPVRLYPGLRSPVVRATPDNCNLVILRENTEGIYAGGGETVDAGTPHAVAWQHSVTTASVTREIVEFAFAMASARRKRLTLCHKKNVLVHSGKMWQDIVVEVGTRFPDVEHDYVHADAMCQHLILDPGRFDVVVTPNLFGDIVSDLGAVLQGGLGVAASANLNPVGSAPSMYEPVHGSAPDIVGTGRANPAAATLSAAMCLAGLGEREAALALEAATANALALAEGDVSGVAQATREIGNRIVSFVTDGSPFGPIVAGSIMDTFADLAGRGD